MNRSAITRLRQFFLGADGLLRPTGAALQQMQVPSPSIARLLAYVLMFSMFFGASLGSFPGLHGPRPLQMLYSALKVPMLQLVSFALTLPAFFIVNTLLGLRNDFVPAVRALISAQAVMSLVLAALAPLTVVWYCSATSYHSAAFFNGALFLIAVSAGEVLVRRQYGPLIRVNPRHKVMLVGWFVVYIFVAIQMAWVLRPYIGDPAQETTFFRPHKFDNAYLVIWKLILRALGP